MNSNIWGRGFELHRNAGVWSDSNHNNVPLAVVARSATVYAALQTIWEGASTTKNCRHCSQASIVQSRCSVTVKHKYMHVHESLKGWVGGPLKCKSLPRHPCMVPPPMVATITVNGSPALRVLYNAVIRSEYVILITTLCNGQQLA